MFSILSTRAVPATQASTGASSLILRTATRRSQLQTFAHLHARTLSTTASQRHPRTMSSPKPNLTPPKDMAVFRSIVRIASESSDFRRVLWTGRNSQLVMMTIPVGGDIGEEIHTVDQHLSILSGTSLAQVNGKEETISAGDVVIVPAGAKHQFINKGPTPLILTTVYAPGEHKADTVHKTKEEGDELEESGKDEPPQWARDLHKKDDGSN